MLERFVESRCVLEEADNNLREDSYLFENGRVEQLPQFDLFPPPRPSLRQYI